MASPLDNARSSFVTYLQRQGLNKQAVANQSGRNIAALAQKPMFASEGPQYYAAATAHNQPYAKPGSELTTLSPPQEQQFRSWVQQYKIPFDPEEKTPDYDMRGYWLANQHATHTIGQHFPDTYKTVRDTTFSNQSKYATQDNPFAWVGNNLIDQRTGTLIMRG